MSADIIYLLYAEKARCLRGQTYKVFAGREGARFILAGSPVG